MTDSASSLPPRAAAPVLVPWGGVGRLALEWPGNWPTPSVFEPDLSNPIGDYASALRDALDAPGAWPQAGIGAGDRVAIVVDDPSRWTPVREALPPLLARLREAGVRHEDIAICVGVGRHAPVDSEAMRRRLGDAIAAAYRCYSPPLDQPDQYADLGTTAEGFPVRVFRPVAEAKLRILIGSVLPHLQAGFGGGWKLIFPGCAQRRTLGALHRQGLGGDVRRLLGSTAGENPMRQAIRRAAAFLTGSTVSISHVLGGPGQVFQIAAGAPDPVQDLLTSTAIRRFRAPLEPPADLVIVGNHPWPGDPMQSFKALLHHRAASRPGGVLVGLFWTDVHELSRSFPLGSLQALANTGVVGGWILRSGLAAADHIVSALGSSAAFMVRWARELVVDRHVLIYSPPLHDRVGPRLGPVRIFRRQAPLWKAVEHARGGRPPEQIRLFPQGGLSYRPVA